MGVAEDVGAATAILLQVDSDRDEVPKHCHTLQRAAIDDGCDVLWVSYARSPAELVDSLPVEDGPDPARAVLLVGDAPTDPPADAAVEVDQVSTPTDLIALGIQLNQYLVDAEGDLVVCFDSVTDMLEYVDVENAYRFLHIVVSHLADAGARAHFYLDPDAYDDTTVDAIVSLCDAVVDPDGEPTVRRRSTSV